MKQAGAYGAGVSAHTVAMIALALWFAALPLYLVGLGDAALRDWDEAIFAQVSREIAANGWRNLLHPTYWGNPYVNKPPLIHVLAGTLFAIFGESSLTARLPGALITSASPALLYLFARKLFGNENRAIWSGIVYLALLPVMRHGRLAMLDGPLVTFFLATLLAIAYPRRSLGAGILTGAGLTAMLLTKALSAAPLFAIAMAYAALSRPHLLRSGAFWTGMLIAVLPALAWFGVQWFAYGDRYMGDALMSQGLSRLWTSVEGNRGAPWYYIVEILKYGWPWLIFVPAGIAIAVKEKDAAWSRLVLVWGGGYLILFSLMATKLPWYAYPLYAPVALLCGVAASDFASVQRDRPQNFFTRRFPLIILPLLACGAAAGAWYFSPFGKDRSPAFFATTGLLCIAFAAAFFLMRNAPRQALQTVACAAYLALLLFSTSGRTNWELKEQFDVVPVAQLVRNHAPQTQCFLADRPERPSLNYYVGRRIPGRPLAEINQSPDLAGSCWLVAQNRRSELPGAAEVLGNSGGFDLVMVR